MRKLDFHNKKTNFYECKVFTERHDLLHSEFLNQAFEQKVLDEKNKKLLLRFINFLENKKNIFSQLYQDMFAEFIIDNNFDKTFLEFGATDGLEYSNSYTLEKYFGWKGVLSEPDPQWHNALKDNRPNTKIIFDCIWTNSNKKLNFLSSDVGVYSTIDTFKFNEKDSMPGNTNSRNKSFKNITVNTISLNDLISIQFNDVAPSYISVDTEGSEYEILCNLDFKKYKPKIFTIEHNYTNYEQKIDNLMSLNGFIRVFKNLTFFDAWYVSEEIMDKFAYKS
jgi:FkbM family methyltransferase